MASAITDQSALCPRCDHPVDWHSLCQHHDCLCSDPGPFLREDEREFLTGGRCPYCHHLRPLHDYTGGALACLIPGCPCEPTTSFEFPSWDAWQLAGFPPTCP